MSVFPLLIISLAAVHSAPSLPLTPPSKASLFVADLVPQEKIASVPWQQHTGPGVKKRTEAITSSSEILYSSGDVYGGDSFVLKPTVKSEDHFLLPPIDSVVPKMTGKIEKLSEEKGKFGSDKDNFGGPITNPAAYYMEGANLEDISAPKCQMVGCEGPLPNDYDFQIQQEGSLRSNKACHQTFVPLNGCLEGRGYPVGMVCTICCDCTTDFLTQMKHSRGYLQGYKA